MRNIPTLSKDDEQFIKLLVKDFYDPICPNPVCLHPASMHVAGEYAICRYEETILKPATSGVNKGMLREEHKKCVCTLTPSEVKENRAAAARTKVAEWSRNYTPPNPEPPPETKAFAPQDRSVMNMMHGYFDRGDPPIGTQWDAYC